MDKLYIFCLLLCEFLIVCADIMFDTPGKPRKGYLKCRTGVMLTIHPDGKVNGTKYCGEYGTFIYLFIFSVYVLPWPTSWPWFYRIKKEWDVPFSLFVFCFLIFKQIIFSFVKIKKECEFNVHNLPYHYTSYFRAVRRHKRVFIGFSRNGKSRVGTLRNRRTKFHWIEKVTKCKPKRNRLRPEGFALDWRNVTQKGRHHRIN
ncbi:uncharacterized protein [Parasteatoda tepidariorum]|uniref:uncharacterized protein n=1 Tax=Parasteatoda tepidariorum TaxID=114398 RepID=UPI0039BD5DCE